LYAWCSGEECTEAASTESSEIDDTETEVGRDTLQNFQSEQHNNKKLIIIHVLLSGSVEGGAQIESPLLDAGFGYVGLERLLVGLVLFTETFQ
jgi:hypothetical protein